VPAFRAAFRRPALELSRLPASGREAQSVARWLGNTDLALGAQASEARLKKASGREMSVLHLASHAVVDDWSSERSFIALAPGDGDDGIVRAADLAALRLRAKLVVLSACRTARGEVIGGEGVQSLGQPFLEQGTRAVVATSWAVADRHALALTDRLYRSLSAGMPVGSALSQAKRTLKAAGASPSEWGAYTLLGDGLLRIAANRAN
jgi:CHAT domain-containing protein